MTHSLPARGSVIDIPDEPDWARKGSLEIVSAELRIVISPGDDWRVDLADLGDFLKTL